MAPDNDMRPRPTIWIALLGAVAALGSLYAWHRRPAPARLLAVGPRVLSNQTRTPLTVVGEGLTPGMALRLGPPFGAACR